jgi:two-component system OmpR family response regulator
MRGTAMRVLRVLLIDDDVELTAMLRNYLSRDGFEVAAVHNGESGVAQALSRKYAIVVLDVMLSDLDGMDVLERIRMESEVPVLVLSGKRERRERIRGLELGADDVVDKPCAPRELAARIRAILRRTRCSYSTDCGAFPLASGPLALWPQQRVAEWDGRPLELTSTEFNLLEVLVRNAGATVSKSALSEQGLGRPLARYDRIIDVHLSKVRRKLGVSEDGRSCIQTVHGVGYQFIKQQ